MAIFRFLYLGLFFLMGCGQNSTVEEMEEVERMVHLVEEEQVEWSLPEGKAIASGESGQEVPVLDSSSEELR